MLKTLPTQPLPAVESRCDMVPAFSRRKAIACLALGALAAEFPRAAFGQQRKNFHRVAYLANDPDPRNMSLTFKAFVDELRKLGWIEGQNIDIKVRTSGGRDELFSKLVAESIQEKADIIVTGGSAATRAAKTATDTIPIVFGSAANPVEQGFVASLARPGGNVTGLSLLVQELGPKRLELLKEMLPRATRFARLYDATSLAAIQPAIIREDESAARRHGVILRQMPVANVDGIEKMFAAAVRSGIEALIVTAAGVFVGNRSYVADMTRRYRIPAMCPDSRFTEAGAVVSYGEDFIARYRRAAGLVDKILRGTKPADIPVEQPAEFELVVNLRTAAALGITIPRPFLVQVDRVIK